MNPTISEIKEQCRAVIALAEKAADGPWFNHDGVWDQNGCNVIADHDKDTNEFIASSRSFTPAAAKALIAAIEWLEDEMTGNPAASVPFNVASQRLESICAMWE